GTRFFVIKNFLAQDNKFISKIRNDYKIFNIIHNN
ncbi:unnamed protein product, partial [marine sediment metagenome]